MKRSIREEIADVQCGCTEGKGTASAIFIMRNIIERSIEVQKDCICVLQITERLKLIKSDMIDCSICLIDLTLMERLCDG